MIFATVGTQLPFDRMLNALDAWADGTAGDQVIAQTGQSGARFQNLQCEPFLSQDRFKVLMTQARVIVSHAGMGTILTAAELGKPIVVMPRQASFGEHRNDHQIATVAELRSLPNMFLADNSATLAEAMSRALEQAAQHVDHRIEATASPELMTAVSNFIATNGQRRQNIPTQRRRAVHTELGL
jgi:UDP-N-acetylglucosamine transferase subunit ALG13